MKIVIAAVLFMLAFVAVAGQVEPDVPPQSYEAAVQAEAEAKSVKVDPELVKPAEHEPIPFYGVGANPY